MTPTTTESTGTAQAAADLFLTATKSGMDLATFEKIELFKKYLKPAKVQSVADALARLGNDNAKLLEILDKGLQAEAGIAARNDDAGWLVQDEDSKEAPVLYDGTLVSNEILNPVVLMFARLNETEVKRGDKVVSITWDEAKGPDEKRAVKLAAIEMIKAQPATVAALKKKMVAASKVSE